MGEAKRRKKLDPNWGKNPALERQTYQEELAKINQEFQESALELDEQNKRDRKNRIEQAKKEGIDLLKSRDWAIFWHSGVDAGDARQDTLEECLEYSRWAIEERNLSINDIIEICLSEGGYTFTFSHIEENEDPDYFVFVDSEIEYRPDLEIMNP